MKSIMVVGNARSGTSMTSGLLSILGVNMNVTPLNSKSEKVIAQNPKGAFENHNFISLTVDMNNDFNSGKDLKFIESKYKDRIKKIVQNHKSELWGFKSALTTRFAGIFSNYMENPHAIFVFRNLLHNAQSWQVHMRDVYGQNVTTQHALDVMMEQQRILVTELKKTKIPKHITTYEDIKKSPLEEAKKIANFLKINFSGKEDEIKNFIMPGYSTLKTK